MFSAAVRFGDAMAGMRLNGAWATTLFQAICHIFLAFRKVSGAFRLYERSFHEITTAAALGALLALDRGRSNC